jgi:hypothetical protein
MDLVINHTSDEVRKLAAWNAELELLIIILHIDSTIGSFVLVLANQIPNVTGTFGVLHNVILPEIASPRTTGNQSFKVSSIH